LRSSRHNPRILQSKILFVEKDVYVMLPLFILDKGDGWLSRGMGGYVGDGWLSRGMGG
jgi:hypothetical protein